jgi:hypothetical protein
VPAAPYAAFLAIVLGSGLAHGWFTNRWTAPPDFARVQAGLAAVPAAVGPWRAADNPVDPDDLVRAGIRASVSRVYRHAGTGKAVTVLLVAGPAGPVAVHTPDVCFRGLGYSEMSAPEPVAAGDGRFWQMECTRPGAAARGRVHVYWSWNGGAGWEAPPHKRTRVKYALKPVLYKLYLLAEGGAGADPVPEFAAAFLPELDRAVAGAAK